MDQSRYSKVERGLENPSSSILEKIAQYLKVKLK
jgi:transcriptional regulator with XRE-family HTH domain